MNSIRSGSKWLLGSNVGSQLVTFIIGVVLARLLLPSDFGLLVTVQIFTGLAGMVAGGGMGQALIRAKKADLRGFHVVFTLQLMICILIYMVFFVVSPWFAVWFDNPLYSDLLRVSALNFLLRPFAGIPRASLQRAMNFRPIAITSVLSMLFTGIISIFLAWSGFGVWSLVLSGIAGSLLTIALLLRETGLKIIGFAFDKQIARLHGSFGIKISINDILSYLRSQTSNFLISRFLGASYVGLFNKADSLAKMPFSTISAAVYEPVLRAMAKEQDDLDYTRYLYFRCITLLILYTLPIYVGISLLAEPFILVVYGEKWLGAAMPLTILAMSGMFYCIGHPSGAVFAAQDKLGIELRIQVEVWAIMTVACLIGLQWGIVGVAWAIVGVQGYSVIRSTIKVMLLIRGKAKDLLAAVIPGIGLNMIMVSVMVLARLTVFDEMSEASPAIYLLGMTLVGTVVYGAAFLFLPISALESESHRWKIKLRLA